MLLQTLLLVATLSILGSALLTSTLVSAKARFHNVVLQQTQLAMSDAEDAVVTWTEKNVRQYGINQLPVWVAMPQMTVSPLACVVLNRPLRSIGPPDCNLKRAISWNVTGYTDARNALRSNALSSEAMNLATAQNEARLSITINTEITDDTGVLIFSKQSRRISERVFHAFPYVAITGERDAGSESSSIFSAEGDTGGYLDQRDRPPPDTTLLANDPARFTNTTLTTTVDCFNSASNLALANDAADFKPIRSYGNLSWSREVPCIPTAPINMNTAPTGYEQPHDNHYRNGATVNYQWNKGDDSTSSFAP